MVPVTHKARASKLHSPRRPRLQQAWELAPTSGNFSIPPAPAGTRFVPVLPNQMWASAPDEAEMARFTVSL